MAWLLWLLWGHPHDRFVPMDVAAVIPTADGPTVVLTDAGQGRLVPVPVAPGEAVSIRAEIEDIHASREAADRLADVLDVTRTPLQEVRLDGYRDGHVLATVVIGPAGHGVSIDAPAAAAIALAVAANAPILVEDRVISLVGWPRTDEGRPIGVRLRRQRLRAAEAGPA
jgi:bifunctional DNase/RNase